MCGDERNKKKILKNKTKNTGSCVSMYVMMMMMMTMTAATAKATAMMMLQDVITIQSIVM